MNTAASSTAFIVRNPRNPILILTNCRDDRWKSQSVVGPGGYMARIFKTEAGAAKHGTPEKVA